MALQSSLFGRFCAPLPGFAGTSFTSLGPCLAHNAAIVVSPKAQPSFATLVLATTAPSLLGDPLLAGAGDFSTCHVLGLSLWAMHGKAYLHVLVAAGKRLLVVEASINRAGKYDASALRVYSIPMEGPEGIEAIVMPTLHPTSTGLIVGIVANSQPGKGVNGQARAAFFGITAGAGQPFDQGMTRAVTPLRPAGELNLRAAANTGIYAWPSTNDTGLLYYMRGKALYKATIAATGGSVQQLTVTHALMADLDLNVVSQVPTLERLMLVGSPETAYAFVAAASTMVKPAAGRRQTQSSGHFDTLLRVKTGDDAPPERFHLPTMGRFDDFAVIDAGTVLLSRANGAATSGGLHGAVMPSTVFGTIGPSTPLYQVASLVPPVTNTPTPNQIGTLQVESLGGTSLPEFLVSKDFRGPPETVVPLAFGGLAVFGKAGPQAKDAVGLIAGQPV